MEYIDTSVPHLEGDPSPHRFRNLIGERLHLKGKGQIRQNQKQYITAAHGKEWSGCGGLAQARISVARRLIRESNVTHTSSAPQRMKSVAHLMLVYRVV